MSRRRSKQVSATEYPRGAETAISRCQGPRVRLGQTIVSNGRRRVLCGGGIHRVKQIWMSVLTWGQGGVACALYVTNE